MAKSNAEKQADWRRRRQEEIESLRAENERLRNHASTSPTGPFSDCTPDEVEYLRRMLDALRQERVDMVMQEAAKMAKESHAKRQPVGVPKPVAGTYWCVGFNRLQDRFEAVEFSIVVNDRGHRILRDAAGNALKLTGSPKAGWKVRPTDGDLSAIYADAPSAEREAYRQNSLRVQMKDALKNGLSGEKRPYKDTPSAELKRIRSEHHPDKGNAHADPQQYQWAVEELDRRR